MRGIWRGGRRRGASHHRVTEGTRRSGEAEEALGLATLGGAVDDVAEGEQRGVVGNTSNARETLRPPL